MLPIPRAVTTWEMGTLHPGTFPPEKPPPAPVLEAEPAGPRSAAVGVGDAFAPLLPRTGQDAEPKVKDMFKSSQGRLLSRRCPRHGSRLHRITNSGRDCGEEAKDPSYTAQLPCSWLQPLCYIILHFAHLFFTAHGYQDLEHQSREL